jgi:hypothetical protein
MRLMELKYYTVDGLYGWDQEKFTDPVMKIGGCAAVTACDSCIYFSKYMDRKELCPFDTSSEITSKEYKAFAKIMKPYLHPRWQGIDTLDIYIDGISRYFEDAGETGIEVKGFGGEEPFEKAAAALKRQIEKGIPVPCLTLKHHDSAFKDFEWHWFMITGYEEREAAANLDDLSSRTYVKVVSYGEWVWLDFERLWNTGYDKKGGLIFFEV